MVWTRIAGPLILFLAAGCAAKERAPELAPPWAVSQERPAVAAVQPPAEKAAAIPAPKPAAAVPDPVVDKPAPSPAAPPAIVPVAPVVITPQAPAVKPEAPVVKPETPAARPAVPSEKPAATTGKLAAPTEKPAAKAPAPPAPKKADAPAPPKPAPATLDLASLEKRLTETSAIGVFTKLTLKNQVDDLLNQFRAYYQGQAKTTLAALRQPYDQLLLKVLSLLQDSDPPLARAIAESREAIWGILSDPEKFKKL